MKKVITVDWDDTLFEDPAYEQNGLWISPGVKAEPIVRVHNFIKEKNKEGYEIYVVSFRNPELESEMRDLIYLYDLPIKSIVCTSGKNKTPTILNLRSTLHIDDNVEVLVLAKMAGVNCLLVDWNQDDVNCTAKEFEKI